MLKIFSKTTDFSPKKQDVMREPDNNSQSGSAIIWVFLMIAIFAALNFAVNQGSRSGGAKITQEKASLAATEILSYARNIKNAVQTLQINGCSDTEISFDQAVVSGYSNPNAPSNESCHVFKLNGGGLNYLEPETEWLDSNYSGQSNYGEWVATGSLAVTNNGASTLDLFLYLPYLKQAVCEEMNDSLNLSSILVDIFSASKFTGSYSASANPEIGDDATGLAGKTTFCAQHAALSWYYFGQILIAR